MSIKHIMEAYKQVSEMKGATAGRIQSRTFPLNKQKDLTLPRLFLQTNLTTYNQPNGVSHGVSHSEDRHHHPYHYHCFHQDYFVVVYLIG